MMRGMTQPETPDDIDARLFAEGARIADRYAFKPFRRERILRCWCPFELWAVSLVRLTRWLYRPEQMTETTYTQARVGWWIEMDLIRPVPSGEV